MYKGRKDFDDRKHQGKKIIKLSNDLSPAYFFFIKSNVLSIAVK